MTFDDGDVVLSIWTAAIPSSDGEPLGGDFLGLLVKTADGKLKLEYRFRYSRGPGFDDGDVINRYEYKPEPYSEALEARTRAAFTRMLETGDRTGHLVDGRETPVNGDIGAFQRVLLDLPGWNTRITRVDPKAGA